MLPKNLAKALESAGGGGQREHSPSPLFSSYFGFSFHHIGADIHLVKKFIWVFSITSYEKVWMNFLTNPIQCPGRKWQPTPVFLLGKFHGQRCLVGYSPWGRKETRLSAHTQTHTHKFCLRAICSLRPPECWSSLENLKADRHLRSASHCDSAGQARGLGRKRALLFFALGPIFGRGSLPCWLSACCS